MSLSNPGDVCVVGFQPGDSTARQSSTLVYCQIEWFDHLISQEASQLFNQEGWVPLVDSRTGSGLPTAWYLCTNFLPLNISAIRENAVNWGPWAGLAHKEIPHWNAVLVQDFSADPQSPSALASAFTEVFARALHCCGAIQYYYTVGDILKLTSETPPGSDTLSTPRRKSGGCDTGADDFVQEMTDKFAELKSNMTKESFACTWDCQNLESCFCYFSDSPKESDAHLLHNDKRSCNCSGKASSFTRLVRNFLIDSLRNESAVMTNTFYNTLPQPANSPTRSIRDQVVNGTKYFTHRLWNFLPSLLYTSSGLLDNRMYGLQGEDSLVNAVQSFNDFNNQGTFTWRIVAGEDTLWLSVAQNNSTSQCLANSTWSRYLAPPFKSNVTRGGKTSAWLMPSTFKPYLCSGGVDIEAADSFSSYLLAAQQQLADAHSFLGIMLDSYNDLYAIYTATLGCVFGAFVNVIVIFSIGIAQGFFKYCGLQVPTA